MPDLNHELKIISFENKKDGFITWCTTTDIKTYINFIQYVIDDLKEPETFMIFDSSTFETWKLIEIAKIYGMRKRTFEERLTGKTTGKFYLMKGTYKA